MTIRSPKILQHQKFLNIITEGLSNSKKCQKNAPNTKDVKKYPKLEKCRRKKSVDRCIAVTVTTYILCSAHIPNNSVNMKKNYNHFTSSYALD